MNCHVLSHWTLVTGHMCLVTGPVRLLYHWVILIGHWTDSWLFYNGNVFLVKYYFFLFYGCAKMSFKILFSENIFIRILGK